MAARRAPLPDLKTPGADTLRNLLKAAHEQLLDRDDEVESLRLQLEKLRRMLFGRSSEKVRQQIEQLELRLEDLESAKAERLHGSEAPRPETAREQRSSRSLPEHLPREIERHLPEHDCCPRCGGRLRLLGDDVSEVLERIPASYKVIRQKGEHPREHLKAFTGTLQADGYAGFHHLYNDRRIYEAACWAHVRRKF